MEQKKKSPKQILMTIGFVIVFLIAFWVAYGDQLMNFGYAPTLEIDGVTFRVGDKMEVLMDQGIKSKTNLETGSMPAKSWNSMSINVNSGKATSKDYSLALYNETNSKQNLSECRIYMFRGIIAINQKEIVPVVLDGVSYLGKDAEEVKEAMKGAKLSSEDDHSLWFYKGNYSFIFTLDDSYDKSRITVSKIEINRKINKDYKPAK